MPQEHIKNDNSSHPNFTDVDLADVIDVIALQEMMDDYYALTGIGVGIIDLNGTVLVGTGWQDICVKFHRAVPESYAFCHESDISLSSGVPPGTFKEYRCKNNMWNIVTPIMLGDRHIGNIFLGQFLYDDEKPDYELFRAQARRFGYDEAEYLAALDRVPRWNREIVRKAMGFYSKLARMISKASYNNVTLADTLARREQAEETLQWARISLESASDALFWIDPNARIVDVNEAACRSLGYSREELLQLSVPDFDPHFNANMWPGQFATLRQRGSMTFESEQRTKDGRMFPVEVVVNHVKFGSEERHCAFVRDISERKRAEDKIKESEHRFRTLFENMNEGVALHTFIHNDDNKIIDYRIVSVNHAYETTLGLAKEAVIGKTSSEIYCSVAPQYLKEFASVFDSQTGYNFETYFPPMEKHFNISVIPWEENGFATIFSDISERIKNEQQLKQFNKYLEKRIAQAVEDMRQKDQMMILQERRAVIGEMIHNIAHQWRQPLHLLGLYLQELPLAYGSPEFNREYLTASVYNSMQLIDHMSQTINDFMNFFRSDKEMTTFCVNEVIKRTLSIIAKSFQGNQIRISFQAGGDLYVNGYPNEYSQALLNIISNARDALIENHPEDAWILIQSFAEGDKTVVTITDNAGGIADEIIDPKNGS
jgi:PAS domain S-box-containing protein